MISVPRIKTTTLLAIAPLALGTFNLQASENTPRVQSISTSLTANIQDSADKKQPKEKPEPFTVDTMTA